MKLHDFQCTDCNNTFEDLVDNDNRFTNCPECGSIAEKLLSAPRIGLYNDPDKRATELKRRSEQHTKKEVAKEHEKFGFKTDGKKRWAVPSKAKSSNKPSKN